MNFLCTTALCVQQYLGIGYVVAQTPNTMVYATYNTEYICNSSGGAYSCTDYPIRHPYDTN